MIERSILAKPSSSYDSSQRLASIPLPLRRTMTRGVPTNDSDGGCTWMSSKRRE